MKLDFEQRQEAERLLERAASDESVLRELVYELVSLRPAPCHCTEAMLAKCGRRCTSFPHKRNDD